MDVTRIREHNHYAKTRSNKADECSDGSDKKMWLNSSHEAAATVSISSKALQYYMQEKNGKSAPQNDISSFEIPEKGTLQSMERDELPVKVVLREGTVEHFIFHALDGKVEDPYELAVRLGNMIFSSENKTDVEERAIDRETGKKLAEYIAKNYLDDSEEARVLLDGVNKYAEKSEMRDKGYTVIMGFDTLPIKPRVNDLQRFAEEKFGYTDVDWSDTEKSSKIVRAFTMEAMSLAQKETRNGRYSEESLSTLLNHDSTPFMYKEDKAAFDRTFSENEKNIQDVINKAKNIMSGITVDDNFFTDMEAVLSSFNSDKLENWSSFLSLLKTND